MKRTITIILFLILTNILKAQVSQFENWDYKTLFKNNVQSVTIYTVETNEKRNNQSDTTFTRKLILDNKSLTVQDMSMNNIYVFITGIDNGYKLYDTISALSYIQFDSNYKKISETGMDINQFGDLTQVTKVNRKISLEYYSDGLLKSKEILFLTDSIRFNSSDTIHNKSNSSSVISYKYNKKGYLVSEYENSYLKRVIKYDKRDQIKKEISFDHYGNKNLEINYKNKYNNSQLTFKEITNVSGNSTQIIEQFFSNDKLVKQIWKHYIDTYNEQILFINSVSTFEYSGDLLINMKDNRNGQLEKDISYEYNKNGLISKVLIKTPKKITKQIIYIYQ